MNRQIKWMGKLNQNGGVWDGSIGASLSAQKLEQYKQLLPGVFKPVAKQAPMRCIDGRVGDTHPKLGPQIAGGGPGFSLAFHVAVSSKGSNVIEDFKNFYDAHHKTNDHFAVGGHIDNHAKLPYSGCGAIDKMSQILEAMTASANHAALKKYTRAIMGSDFAYQTFKDSLTKAAAINTSEYFKEHGHSYRQDFLGEIKKRSTKKTIEELHGAHKEVFAVINMAKSSTLDKEDFVAKTDNKVQAFNYDYWYSKQLARKLFKKNSQASLAFVTTNVIYNVATAMVLTDGSLELAVRG